MSFTVDEVLAALHALLGADTAEVEAANEYIFQWTSSNSALPQMCEIIDNATDISILLLVLPGAKNQIISNWVKYNRQMHESIRNMFCNKVVEYAGDNRVTNYIIDIITQIALKDWPHEWPDCLENFINSITVSQELCVLDFHIIGRIVSAVHSTDTLTKTRRDELIAIINENTPRFIEMVGWALQNIDENVIQEPVISLLCPLCLTAPIESILTEGMLHAFYTDYCYKENTRKTTIKALENLLLIRPDCEDVFNDTIDELLTLFLRTLNPPEEEQTPEDQQQADGEKEEKPDLSPLPFYDEIYIFILEYLDKYAERIEDLIGDDQIDADTVELIQNIYTGVLNHPPTEEYIEEFWMLWSNILLCLRRANMSRNRFEILKPVTEIFTDMIPAIRESLFAGFNTAMHEGKLRSVYIQAAWMSLSAVDTEGMCQFLIETGEPSTKFCYALGLVDCTLSTSAEESILSECLMQLLEFNQQAEDIEYSKSLLYLLARSMRFITREDLLVNIFIDCIIQFLQSDDSDVVNSAAAALLYSATRMPNAFINPITVNGSTFPLIEKLIDYIPNWAALEDKSAVATFQAVGKIALRLPESDLRNAVYEALFSSAASQLTTDKDEIMRGLHLITTLAELKLPNSMDNFISLYQPLKALVEQSRDITESLIFMHAASTIVMILKPYPYTDIQEGANDFMQTLLTCENMPESALSAINDMRRNFPALQQFAEPITEKFVGPMVQILMHDAKEIIPGTQVLEFFRTFDIEDSDIENILDLTLRCIQDARTAVCREASKLLRRLIERSKGTQTQDIFVEHRDSILTNLITSITDTYHLQVFNQLCKALYQFYLLMLSTSFPKAQFDNEVSNALAEYVSDKTTRNNIASELRRQTASYDKFIDVLRQVLITIKAASSTDKNLFKKELKLDALRKELETMADENEKGAIRAEELDLIPLLSKLSITRKDPEQQSK